jgi:hypothetical protein
MPLCYARSNLQQRSGILVRNLIALFVLLLPAAADAASLEVWHAVVAPPRPVLPTVTIDLGYPGPYISPITSPITLRATTGDVPFDGYIGFHLAVNNARTFNVPIISRAVIGPHQTWTFVTEADLRYFGKVKRELVIEWWDRLMTTDVFATARIPPWSERPRRLRVLPAGQTLPISTDEDSVEHADALSDTARWYSGFRSFVIPLAVWLDLPARVREAVFASGIQLVFSGLPKPAQTMNAIDRALLPVVFDPRPGSYEIPWPYQSAPAPVAVPVSWKAKAGTASAGSSGMPYIVSSEVATWVADDAALNRALPVMSAVPRYLPDRPARGASPTLSEVFRSFFPLTATFVITLMSLVLWVMMRRSPRRVLVFVALAASTAIVLGRDRIRPMGHGFNRRLEFPGKATTVAGYTYSIHSPLAPGIVDNFTVEKIYGASPLPAKQASAEFLRTSITSASHDENSQNIEIRNSATAPGWGAMLRGLAWDAVSRSSERRELAEGPVIRVLQREPAKLVVEYESSIGVDRISAEWICGDTGYFGAVPANGGKRGTATIESGITTWSPLGLAWWEIPVSHAVASQPAPRTKVTLYQKSRDGIQVLQWRELFAVSDRKPEFFYMNGRLEPDANGARSILFAIPVALVPSTATAIIGIPKDLGTGKLTIGWGTGTIELTPATRDDWRFTVAYAIPPETFRQIVHDGGILQVTAKVTDEDDQRAFIQVLEKKP